MIRFLSVCLCVAGMMAGAALPVHAEEKPPKELVENLSKRAFDGFLAVKNKDGQTFVKKEDAKKLKHPLTSYEDREKAVARGYLSGYAKWCDLPWEKDFFAPYAASLRADHKKSWSEFQYAYSEVLHGAAMAVAIDAKKGKKCDAAEKKRIAALAKK